MIRNYNIIMRNVAMRDMVMMQIIKQQYANGFDNTIIIMVLYVIRDYKMMPKLFIAQTQNIIKMQKMTSVYQIIVTHLLFYLTCAHFNNFQQIYIST